MDLRKSIEKAKKMRLETKQPIFRDIPAQGEKREESGWISPIYCDSEHIELDRKKAGQNRCVCIFPDAPEMDYYKMLRTQIQLRCKQNGWNTLMITSIQPEEGKTLTSINLALTLAQEFTRTVLLVDCDLVRQDIHKRLGLPSDRGIIDHIVSDIPVKDLIIWPGIEKLTVISGGNSAHNTTELLSSPKMEAAVAEMKKRYEDRYILFDLPPLLSSADALAFVPLVDCILIVVEAGRTKIKDIRKALEMIPKEKFLGFVLNRQKSPANSYYYSDRYYRKRRRG